MQLRLIVIERRKACLNQFRQRPLFKLLLIKLGDKKKRLARGPISLKAHEGFYYFYIFQATKTKTRNLENNGSAQIDKNRLKIHRVCVSF